MAPTRAPLAGEVLPWNVRPIPIFSTRDVGRLFFGRDVQCARCHDHPLVKDFEQREYYGLLSYFQRTELFKDAKGVYMLAEKADGDAMYQSVFKTGSKYAARPALPGGAVEHEPHAEAGKEYSVVRRTKFAPYLSSVGASCSPNQRRRVRIARSIATSLIGSGR